MPESQSTESTTRIDIEPLGEEEIAAAWELVEPMFKVPAMLVAKVGLPDDPDKRMAILLQMMKDSFCGGIDVGFRMTTAALAEALSEPTSDETNARAMAAAPAPLATCNTCGRAVSLDGCRAALWRVRGDASPETMREAEQDCARQADANSRTLMGAGK